jgi:quercetin dioxygenase-like cupin family protein
MHFHGRSDDIALTSPRLYANHSEGYTHAPLVDHTTGSVHTGLSVNQLASSGTIAPHLHSYEKGFYILEGEAVLSVADRSWRLAPGDFGAFKVGTLHAWRNLSQRPVRWLQVAAPQPKPEGEERDTFFAGQKQTEFPAQPKPLPVHDLNAQNELNGALLGHFDAGQIPPPGPARDALPGAKGVFLKWLVDEKLGARHHRLLFIEYLPGSNIGLHDHTFEETYLLLSGEVEAILDGKRYLARAGDVLWTGVGCVHSFANIGSEPARWLETFAPQPPAENVFRFAADWERRAKDLEG